MRHGLLFAAMLLASAPLRTLGSSGVTASRSPLLFQPPLNQGNFVYGDRLFRRGDYRKAALAYYQMFYCGQGTELNPRISEVGDVYSTFRAAVAIAVSGDFGAAAARLRRLKIELPEFTEAGYLAGSFAWAAGDHKSARRSWEDAVHGPHFPIPEITVDLAQTAAQQMSTWSQNK